MSEHAKQQDEELKKHGEALQQAMPEPKSEQADQRATPVASTTEKE